MGNLRSSSSSSPSSLCPMISTIFSGILLLNIRNVQGFDSLLHLPSSGYFRNTSRSMEEGVLYVNDFGAKGDGLTDDTKAFIDVWNQACSSSSSRSSIVIPSRNSYLLRPIDFAGPCRSKVTLRISGSIVAPKDPEVWGGHDTHKWLYFHGVKHLTVEGGGTVDGMGHQWWSRSCKINSTNPCRHAPTALTFHRCKNLKIRNFMIKNSQQMHIAFTHCYWISISHLRVLAPVSSPNTDGIHVSASTRVEIKNSIIGTGDDCISIVSNSSRIRIRGIVCGPGHGISIGSLGKSKSWNQVHDISVKGAFISNTENGVRIKTWQGGSGFVRKIRFENIWMENVSNPIIIDQYYCDSPSPCANQSSAVQIKNISFKGIKGTSATEEAIRFACSDSFPCKKLYLEDIQLVSCTGGITSSFCWEANGKSVGQIYPSSCLSCGGSGTLIHQKVLPFSSVLSSI